MEIRKIKTYVTHQEIGGKEIMIDEGISQKLTPQSVYNRAMSGNIACLNFINRRKDFDPDNFNHKVYYGKVGILGYVVADDELEEVNVFDEIFKD